MGGNSSNHYTIELVSDCPTVTMLAGKRINALIDSGTVLSLVCTSIYNMTEDCYNTKILPATVHLKDRGWISNVFTRQGYLTPLNSQF